MDHTERLINSLNSTIARLEQQLSNAQQDILDFEKLAIEWRKGHAELEAKHRIEVGNLKATIEELEAELKMLEIKLCDYE